MAGERFRATIFCSECDFEAAVDSEKQQHGSDVVCPDCGTFLGRWLALGFPETVPDQQAL